MWPWRNTEMRRVQTNLYRHNRVAESTIKQVIEQFCDKAGVRYMRNRDVKFVKTSEGQLIPAPIGESQRGKPDLTIVLSGGRTMWIETKSTDGRLSQDQMRWRDDLIKQGHAYHAPSTIEEAHAIVSMINMDLRAAARRPGTLATLADHG